MYRNPELYNEVKKQVNLSLTPTAIAKLDGLAKEHKLSRSEFVEQIARGLIQPIKTKQNNRISREFILYPTQSLSLQERNNLPEEMGSFLVSDLIDFAYIDSCSNLKEKFQSNDFINKIKQLKKNSNYSGDYLIFWIKCDDPNNMSRTEKELVSQFRSSKTYRESFSVLGKTAKYTRLFHLESQ